MKTLTLVLVSILLVALAACGGRGDKVSDVEIQATVQAALYATSAAQANSANAVNSAVNATLTAVAPTHGPQVVIITATPQPTLSIPIRARK